MKSVQTVVALLLVVISVVGGIYTVAVNNQPLLGIDLQGGVSVILEPTNPDEVDAESLDEAVEIIRSRVDGLGVAEPEIVRQDDTISVVLPGVENQQRAVELVGQTAELRFRPVLADTSFKVDVEGGPLPTVPFDERQLPEVVTTLPPEEDPALNSELVEGDTEAEGNAVEGDDAATTTTAEADTDANQSIVQPAMFSVETELIPGTDDDTVESVESDAEEVEEGPDAEGGDGTEELDLEDADGSEPEFEVPVGEPLPTPTTRAIDPSQVSPAIACANPQLTPVSEDNPEDVVFLPDENGLLVCLGPVYQATTDGPLLTGNALESASVGQLPTGEFTVNPTFRAGAQGIDLFNQAAQACSTSSMVCPEGRLAAVLDQKVLSAPAINASSFQRDRVEITGQFTQEQADELALQLRFGALPVELKTGPVDQISASTGSDVLRAGTIAGGIGLLIVAAYLLYYYRLAGLVAIGGLILSGLLLWTIVAFIGETFGLALTLSGVVGLIVAIGVSADSNIVYFENVKETFAEGRRLPTAIERAYQTAISTIVKADTVSLIAAVLLYALTIGQVRGFALFLGLGTLLDLIISWLFMRPALSWLSHLKSVRANPMLLGLPVKEDS